ncbi:MAG: DegV family protein [Lachnospiraceae bacterium]|nr:DegV family protein [Lachnospiraceae bacterium]
MGKVAIITDSNSGITQMQAKQLGISVIPMPFFINEQLFLEDITLSQKEFYQYLGQDADIKTSQPAVGDILELWDQTLKEYDEIVHIPMSSGLSGSCQTAIAMADDYDGRVQVVDNKRISVTMKQSVLEAIELAKKGYSAKEIRDILERDGLKASIYIAVDTLKYLKKGGRITPAAASVGMVMNIKPVLQIQGGKLDTFAKVRGMKQARKKMLEAIEDDLNGRFAKDKTYICGAYTCSDEEAEVWKQEIQERFPHHKVYLDRLSLSVSCHIGPGALAVVIMKQLEEAGYVDGSLHE